nr:immunoglobulin heavy chain junction region [Mus musculus]MBK4195169.1 immunoglobulin heavy chain junction region [Mus musculus]MBK4195170.1 immunoglobulin heavy chain junction region [Mus musculus]MBK4195171.1 immunoglobulin heavy chain junction region [Mus musculus]
CTRDRTAQARGFAYW